MYMLFDKKQEAALFFHSTVQTMEKKHSHRKPKPKEGTFRPHTPRGPCASRRCRCVERNVESARAQDVFFST